MNVYIKIILRTDWCNKDGSRTVNLRVTINRKVKLISLKIKVFENHWSLKDSKVFKRDPQYLRKNKYIRKNYNKANKIVDDYLLNDKILTFAEFEKHFFNDTYGTSSFYEFIESELNKEKTKLAKETLKGKSNTIKKRIKLELIIFL